MYKTALLVLFLGLSTLVQAQKTPEELAQFLYKAIRAENVKAVGTYLCTPDEALLFSKTLGYSYTKEQGDDYKANQLVIDTAFIDQCRFIITEGKGKGIVWAKTEFVSVKNGIETYILSSKDESKTADMGPVSVIFKHGADHFILTFATAFEASGRWRITGEEIKLKRYNP